MGVVVHRGVGVNLEHVKVGDADLSADLGAASHPRAHHPEVDPKEAVGQAKDAKSANLHSLVGQPPPDVRAAPQRVQTGLQTTEHGPLEHHGHDREEHERDETGEQQRHEKRNQAQVVKVFIIRINPGRPDDDGDRGVVADVVHGVDRGVKPVDAEGPHVEENGPSQNLLHGRKHQQRQRLKQQREERGGAVGPGPLHRSQRFARHAGRQTAGLVPVLGPASLLLNFGGDLLDAAVAEDVGAREVRAELATDIRRELPSHDGAAANLEEVVVQSHGPRIAVEGIRPRLRHRPLGGGEGGAVVTSRLLTLPQRQERLRVALAVRGPRDLVHRDDILGLEKPREAPAGEGHHLLGVGIRRGHRPDERVAPRGVDTRRRVLDAGRLGQRTGDALRRLVPGGDGPVPGDTRRPASRVDFERRLEGHVELPHAVANLLNVQRLGDGAPANLTSRELGDLVHEHEALGPLRGWQPIARVLAQLSQARLLDPPRGHHHHGDSLLERRVRDGDGHDVRHARVRLERLLHLRRGDDLAAPVDHLFAPSGDVQVPVRVHPTHVPGFEPPAGVETPRRRLDIVLVPFGHDAPLDHDVRHAAVRDAFAGIVDDGDLRADGLPGAARSLQGVPRGRARDWHALRHAVRREHRRVVKHLPQLDGHGRQ